MYFFFVEENFPFYGGIAGQKPEKTFFTLTFLMVFSKFFRFSEHPWTTALVN